MLPNSYVPNGGQQKKRIEAEPMRFGFFANSKDKERHG